MAAPKYGQNTPTTSSEGRKPAAPMTAGSWIILAVIVAAVVAFLGPVVINLWRGALG